MPPICEINNCHFVGFDQVISTITLYNCGSDARIVKSCPAALQIHSVSVIADSTTDGSGGILSINGRWKTLVLGFLDCPAIGASSVV